MFITTLYVVLVKKEKTTNALDMTPRKVRNTQARAIGIEEIEGGLSEDEDDAMSEL